MSNLPPNRKSCFQITNVREAASSITDDTENLDDPDESQTEDGDISRADLGVCDQSLSEGTLNNVGEHQEGQPASIGPVNGGFSVQSGGGGVPVPPTSQPSIPSSTPTTANLVPSGTVSASVAQANPVSTSTMSTPTCSSRFRIIKIMGRWSCTEFYGHEGPQCGPSCPHQDHNVDRYNSRLGVTGGSVVIPSAVSADSGHSVTHHTHPPEPLQQGYGSAYQIGSGVCALQPTGYSYAVPQHLQDSQVNIPQTHTSSLNGDGASHGAMLQKYQIIPPTQQFVYSSQAGGHAGGHPDHPQQQFAPLQPQGSNPQNLPMGSTSVGPPASQEPSPVITPVVPGAQGLGMTAQGGEAASALGAHGGAPAGPPVSCSSQAEDNRRKSDVLPQPSTDTLSGKVGMKVDSESLCLPDSLFGHAIANKIDQVLDMVKSNLMYAIREEWLKEKIKELVERNSALESENSMLKSLANTDQLSQLLNQISPVVSTSPPQQQQLYHHPSAPDPNAPLVQHEGGMSGSQLDYQQQQFSTLQPQGSNIQNLPMASFSVGPPDITPVGPGSQGLSMVAQGGEAASVQSMGSETSMGSVQSGVPPSAVTPTTTTIHGSVQNVTATVPPSTTHTPPDILGQTPSAGGLIQDQGAHGEAPLGLSVAYGSQAEDSRRTSDFLPQPSTDALSEKDGMKPFISESLGPSTSTVESKFDIPIDLDVEEESTSDGSVVAIDNKIEQALDLVKNHLTYAVRGEVEVLKEKIKVQYEKNSVLEHENSLLKSLVNTDQLGQLSNRQPDYQQQQFTPEPPSNQNLHQTTVVSEAQGLDMVAQGRDAASAQGLMLQVGSGASMDSMLPGIPPAIITTHSSVPPGLLSQTQSAGGLVQAQGAHEGAPVGLPVGSSSQAEDSRQKSDFLPQQSTSALTEKDGISECVSLLTPTVDSLFDIPIAIDGEEGSASDASVVAIDNKIEQALDLVKSHLLNAVQEEVEELKDQIKEQYWRNSVLEHENTVLKSLLNTDQLGQLSNQISSKPDYQQQQIGPLQPQGSNAQGLGMEAQGGEAASAQDLMLQVGSVGASTGSVPPGVPPTSAVTPSTSPTHSSVQNVTSTVPSTINTPLGILSQASSVGGLVQAQGACGGSLVGFPVDLSSQAEDSRQQKSAVLHQPSTDNLSAKEDGMKPFISEILGPPTPTVDSQFAIPIDIDGEEDGVASARVVAIYKKVEQAMDLVKSHLMYAVQEEMKEMKEKIKEQYERNSVLEHENNMLKALANTDQLSQLSSQISPVENTSPLQQQLHHHHHLPATTNNNTSVLLAQHDQEQMAPPTSPTSHRHDPNPPPQ